MNTTEEKPQQINDVDGVASSVPVIPIQNKTETESKSGTPLTQPRSRHVRTGNVYFVRSGHSIKIGYSLEPGARIRDLQIGAATSLELLGTIPGTRQTEKALHRRFARLHERGEWFRAERELLTHISRITGKIEARPMPASRRHLISPEAKETIAGLLKMRAAHGADSPIGHRCSNIEAMLRNGVAPASIARQATELKQLLSASVLRCVLSI